MSRLLRGPLSLSACGLLLGCGLLFGACKKTVPTPSNIDPAVRRTKGPLSVDDLAEKGKASAKVDDGWHAKSWATYVLTNPTAIPSFFGKDSARRADLAAMWDNKWEEAAARSVQPKSLVPGHLAIRARVFLRMARFYREAYRLGSALNLGRLTKREGRAKKLNPGKLFHYYLGRQQCMSKYRKRAKASLLQAQKLAPASHQSRVSLWLALCEPGVKASDPKLLAAISALDFSKDPGGVAELLLAKYFFGLVLKVPQADAKAPRALLYQQLFVGMTSVPASSLVKGIAETEEIKEGEISATLEYFDPGLLWGFSLHFARRALAALSHVPKTDLYAPFFRAQAHHYMGQAKESAAALAAFEKNPPKEHDLAYTLFSRRASVAEMLAEVAMIRARQEPDAAKRLALYKALAKKPYPTCAPAMLALIRESKDKAVRRKALVGLVVSVALAKETSKKLFVAYTKAIAAKTPKGATDEQKAEAQTRSRAASALIKWQVHRYAVRSSVLTAIRGALAYGSIERAVRWSEQLHRKDFPYMIGGRNEAYQFILTAQAYTLAGKMGIATLYLSKSKKMYPALTQLWSLLRILRIYRGTEGGSVIVMPKGG